MKYVIYFLLLSIWVFSCQSPPSSPEDSAIPQPEWKALFNGTDLSGWVVKINGYELGDNFANTFRVEEGLLTVSYEDYERYDTRYGALITEESFDNYRLRVEYRFVGDTATAAPPWGYRDSGIQYHGQSPESMEKDQPFPVCLEYNLHGGDGVNERPMGHICTIGTKVKIKGQLNTEFTTFPDIRHTFHGDQWVTAEIEVKGDSISHWVNGEKILSFSHPQYDPEHEYGKTLIQGDDPSIRSGHISLQSNSAPIQFKKIEVMEFE